MNRPEQGLRRVRKIIQFPSYISTAVRMLALGALCVTLSACKVELYTELEQRDGNEMLAVLLQNGIDADKVSGKKGTVILRVEESELDSAIGLLQDRGLPRDKVASIGDIFSNQGLISSPTEERARFVYAMSEELTGTLSELDGAIAVRVHVVIPEKKPNQRERLPASAAIFIKHRDNFDFSAYVPQIKELVANSIEGLNYDKVSVVLFPSAGQDRAVSMQAGAAYGGLPFGPDAVLTILAGLLGAVLLLSGALGYTVFLRKSPIAADQQAPPVDSSR